MARTYKTLSLSLPPGVFKELAAIGKKTDRTGARVAAEIVLREIAKQPPKKKTHPRSWCCQAHVIPVQSPLVIPERHDMNRTWVTVVVFLCGMCRKQMHGREYEGWITDA